MYGWDEDPSSWHGEGKYEYGERGKEKRKRAADEALRKKHLEEEELEEKLRLMKAEMESLPSCLITRSSSSAQDSWHEP